MQSGRLNWSVRSSLALAAVVALVTISGTAHAEVLFADGFESNTSNNVVPAGWSSYKNWTRGPTATGTNAPNSFSTTGPGAGHPFYGHNWPDNDGRFVAASGNGASPSLIDLWLVSPQIQFNGAGGEPSFWAFSLGGSTASVEVRLSTGSGVVPNNGGSYDNDLTEPLTGGIGEFEHLLLTVNPTRSSGGFPTFTSSLDPVWTEYRVTIPAGLAQSTGHLAFRSFGSNVFALPDYYRTVALDDVSLESIASPQLVKWTSSVDGNWSDAAKWSTGLAPSGADTHVLFGDDVGSAASPRTVNNDTSHTVAKVTFDRAHGYTIAGNAALSVQKQISVIEGSHHISTPVSFLGDVVLDTAADSTLALDGPVDAAGFNVDKTGPGSLTLPAFESNRLGVTNGKVAFSGAGQAKFRSLVLLPRTQLDVGHVVVAIDYASGSASPRDAIRAAIVSGQVDSAGKPSNQAIGYVDTAALPVDGHDADSLLFGLTFKGDVNLDLSVDFDDLLALAQNYDTAGTQQWYHGDSTFDGLVNFDDLLALAQNYGLSFVEGALFVDQSLADAFDSHWALAQSLVPEPASLSLLLGVGLLPRRRSPQA